MSEKPGHETINYLTSRKYITDDNIMTKSFISADESVDKNRRNIFAIVSTCRLQSLVFFNFLYSIAIIVIIYEPQCIDL